MEKKSLEDRAKEIAKLLINGKKWDVNPFKQHKEIVEIIDYFEKNEYIELRFPTNKYMARYEFTDKGKEWALSQ